MPSLDNPAGLTPVSLRNDSANLDLLRSLAVLYVVYDHFLVTVFDRPFWIIPESYLGRLGVLLFFVHTSLVLMLSMGRLHETGARLFRSFYIRRAFRIYPLSVLTCVLLVTFHIPRVAWHAAVFEPVDGPTLLSNLLLVQNLTLHDSILGPLWSLPLEMQMYLVLPVMFLLLRDTRRLWPVLAMMVLAVVLALVQIRTSARLSIFSFAPCFMGGILAFQMLRRNRPQLPSYLWPIVIGLVTVTFLLLPGTHLTPWRGWLVCALIGAAIPCFADIQNRVVVGTVKRIARYSYGVYLSHVPLLWLIDVKLDPALPRGVRLVLLFVAMAVVPVVLYHALEAPFIRFGAAYAKKLGSTTKHLMPV